ncbi:MAG: ABC transporter permease [Rhodospirillales bacterium]|nr:ABC transporter permease [Rhodospirillales bacterium]
MSALDRKLARDLLRLRGQVVTIAAVIACGIAIFVSSLATFASLQQNQAAYYRAARFADVFVSLKRAPDALLERLRALPGIGQIEPRIVRDITIDLPGQALPLAGRLISLPADAAAPRLDRLYLRRGRLPAPRAAGEVLVNEAFAAANHLRPGDQLAAILNGKLQAMRIVGVALSPEYVFATRAGDAIPDDKRFGVLWMDHDAAAAAFDMTGAFNDLVVSLAPGARAAEVMRGLDRLLTPYGGLVAYARRDQPSNRFLSDEIAQQRTMATTIPVVFLAVSAFLLHVVLGRLVASQREQIASLKAIGYATVPIAWHYLKLAGAVILAGALPGIALGLGLGWLLTRSYTSFFRFPLLAFHVQLWAPPLAVGVALLAGMTGVLSAVRAVVRLAPAEAMRPPAPQQYRAGWLDRALGRRLLSARWRITLRGITGRKLRAVLTVLGVALAVPVIMVSRFWNDALDYMMDVQFAAMDRGDVTVTFTGPVAASAGREIARLPGVLLTEGFRAVPVRLVVAHRSYRTAILGLPADAALRRPLDRHLRPIALPAAGVLLSQRLAERLHVRPGALIRLELLEGERPQRSVTVAGLADDMIGLNAYMRLDALNRLMREGDTISAVDLRTDGRPADALYRALKGMPKVESVTVKALALQLFRATTVFLVLVMAGIFTLFSTVIAIGVVYNNARIALQERGWELATLRVLGFTRAEVAGVLLAEIALEIVAGIPLGLWLGVWLVRGMVVLNETEMFSIPAIIETRSYVLAAAIVFVAGLASALLVRRRIDGLDLIGVLKTRE